MEDFEVTIVRTITTVIKVNSSSRAAAIRQVSAYGVIEAVGDYTVRSENVEAKITRATSCITQ